MNERDVGRLDIWSLANPAGEQPYDRVVSDLHSIEMQMIFPGKHFLA
jgi:hypothetical protein